MAFKASWVLDGGVGVCSEAGSDTDPHPKRQKITTESWFWEHAGQLSLFLWMKSAPDPDNVGTRSENHPTRCVLGHPDRDFVGQN